MADRLERLSEAMRSFGEATADPQLLLSTIAERIAEAMGAYCGFALMSEDERLLRPVAFHDRDPAKRIILDKLAAEPLSLDSPLPAIRAVRSGECVLIQSLTADQLRAHFPRPEDLQQAVSLAIKTVLFVPLRAQGKVMGALSLVRHGEQATPFEDIDVRFAQNLADHAALAITNARLFSAAQRELSQRSRLADRLRILSELSQEFAGATGDYAHLLRLVARRLAEVVGEACTIRMISADRTVLEPSSTAFDRDPDRIRSIEMELGGEPQRVGEGVSGRAAATGQSIRIAELTPPIMAAIEERYRSMIERYGLRSVIAVPLRAAGAVIGVVTLYRTAPDRPYQEDELRLVEDLAAHAALALTNARLLEESHAELAERERLADRLRILTEAAREFSAATGDYGSLLDLVARRVSEIVGDLCVIRMVSSDGEWMEMMGSVHHPNAELVRAMREAMISFPLRVGEGVTGKVAATGEPVLVPKLTTEHAASTDAKGFLIERLGITSMQAVPIFSQGRVIGVISTSRCRPRMPYTTDDLSLLQDLAGHAALAITNGRLLEASKMELAERMRTEEVLRRGFLEAAPDAVLIVNPKGRILLVNSQTETLFGYQRAELVGLPIEALVPERFRSHHPSHRAGYLHGAVTRPMGEGLNLFAMRKDGSEFAAEISLSPIETPEGTLVAAAVRDVTERRREMEERNRRMQEANRLKSEFLANMSHELRTPLNAIIGFAALMHGGKVGPLAEVHHEYLGDILNSSRHLLQLINDILDLAKVESGRVELRAETIDLSKVVNEVKDIVRGLAADRGVKLGVELHGGLREVVVDPRMLKQVLYNYLSNAIKFTSDGGQVSLRIGPEDPTSFRIEVEDTGIGIRPEDMDRLFVEFQQLDQGTSKRYPGTGLGLALTKRIVEAHGGRVAVKSAPGRGSTFSAILPKRVEAR